MSAALLRARSYAALGLRNLARVGIYRIGLRAGIHPVLRTLARSEAIGVFFRPSAKGASAPSSAPVLRNTAWDTDLRLWGHHLLTPSASIPNFLANPLTGRRWRSAEQEWFRIPDFDPEDGDVKTVWELSRFEWAAAFAQLARQGDDGALDRLNEWLSSWSAQNPPFRGPNWKCGQEGSIRILHLAAASLILGPAVVAADRLLDFVETHLHRIRPTLSYALGQDNNHGTSEAAALYVGGSWLEHVGRASGRRFARLGRRWLEERAARLFLPDGTFSQYSVNYQRLAVDTYVLAEVWRRSLRLPAFSDALVGRLEAATNWLHTLVDPATGDAPNLGHNDGARILVLTDAPYRDYRPTVARGMALFAGEQAYSEPGIAADLAWLGIEPGGRPTPHPGSRLFPDGGIAVLRQGQAMVLLRYPKFRFRPGHDDVMHLDLWLDGRPVLPDGGSYSYNAGEEWVRYFMGAESHNSVTFDGRGHMPKLGRFLFGAWPKADGPVQIVQRDDGVGICAGYRDWRGSWHRRDLTLGETSLTVVDDCGGSADRATLRWRLGGGFAWSREAAPMAGGKMRIRVTAAPAIAAERICTGHESLHYNEKSLLPVWEIDLDTPGRFETRVNW